MLWFKNGTKLYKNTIVSVYNFDISFEWGSEGIDIVNNIDQV